MRDLEETVRELERAVAAGDEQAWRERRFRENMSNLIQSFSQAVPSCSDPISHELFKALNEVSQSFKEPGGQAPEQRSLAQRNHQLCEKIMAAGKMANQKIEENHRLERRIAELGEKMRAKELQLGESEAGRRQLQAELARFENLGRSEEEFITSNEIYEALERSEKIEDLQGRYMFEEFIRRGKTLSDHLRYVCLELKIKRERIQLLQEDKEGLGRKVARLEAALARALAARMQGEDEDMQAVNH